MYTINHFTTKRIYSLVICLQLDGNVVVTIETVVIATQMNMDICIFICHKMVARKKREKEKTDREKT